MKDLKDLSDEELNIFSDLLEVEHDKSTNLTLEQAKEYAKLFKEILAEIKKRKLI